MAPLPLRPLIAGGRPSLAKLTIQSDIYVHLENRVHALKQQLFGYAKGMPGESAWLKPLRGKEMIEYYWPCKHDLPSFHVEQYLKMQARRFAPKKTHPALISLSRLLCLMGEKRREVQALLSQVDVQLFKECPTLQDLYAVYRALFTDDPLRGIAPDEKHWQWTDRLHPHTLLALLEASAKLKGDEGYFDKILEEAQKCRTVDELKVFLQRRVGEELAAPFFQSLLFLSTRGSMVLPAPCVSYKASRPGWSSERSAGETDERESAEATDRADSRLRLMSLAAAASREQPASRRKDKTEEDNALKHYKRNDAMLKLDALSLGLLGPPRLRRHDVRLEPEDTEKELRQMRERQLQAQQQLHQAMESDTELKDYIQAEHRFFDPLFKRRRISFLDRLARSRIKSQTGRELRSAVYVQHPDQHLSFPTNKGLLTRRWPSPYH